MPAAVTYLQYEDPEVVITFSNFVEYPAPKEPVGAKAYLYFTLGVKCRHSGLGFILNDVRLTDGGFQNPYHKTAYRSRAHGYLNPKLAEKVEDAWVQTVMPQMPRWKLYEGAWEGLSFDAVKVAATMDAPYKVWSKDVTEKTKRERAEKKVGII